LKNNIHLNVDKVYSELSTKIPTLSRTTVYNTLKLFEKKGLINSLKIEENEIRYDALKHIHGHFKCDTCGNIYDFKYNHEKLKYKGLELFEIKHMDFNLSGICPECKH